MQGKQKYPAASSLPWSRNTWTPYSQVLEYSKEKLAFKLNQNWWLCL